MDVLPDVQKRKAQLAQGTQTGPIDLFALGDLVARNLRKISTLTPPGGAFQGPVSAGQRSETLRAGRCAAALTMQNKLDKLSLLARLLLRYWDAKRHADAACAAELAGPWSELDPGTESYLRRDQTALLFALRRATRLLCSPARPLPLPDSNAAELPLYSVARNANQPAHIHRRYSAACRRAGL